MKSRQQTQLASIIASATFLKEMEYEWISIDDGGPNDEALNEQSVEGEIIRIATWLEELVQEEKYRHQPGAEWVN